MVVTARLSHTLHQTLGDEAADDLVNWMALVESNRSELREVLEVQGARVDVRFVETLRAMDAKFAEARAASDVKFAEARAASDAKFAEARADSDAKFAEARKASDARFASVEASIARLEVRMEQRFADLLKWSFVFWVGAVGAIAALAGVLN